MLRTSRRSLIVGLAAGVAAPAVARGQTAWPEKAIKIVVPFPPGGAADFSARLLAARMSEGLRQPVVIDNRPGAGTTIANDIVAKAPPDGYALLQVNRDMAISPSTYTSLPYDTLKGFAWIGKAADGPFVLVANPVSGIKTLAGLVERAKARPGTIGYGNLAVGGLAHLNMEALMRRQSFELLQVPYKGAGPALNATVAGEVPLTMAALTGALPFLREGRLVALAVGASRRASQLPDVPTVAEAGGGEGTVLATYFALAAPAGTPRPIIDRLSGELERAMAAADVREKLEQNGLVPAFTTPEELGAQVTSDVAHFAQLVKAIGLQPQ